MKTKASFFAASYDTIKNSLYRFLILSLFCFSWTQSYAANTNNFHDMHDFAGQPTDGSTPRGSLLDNGVLYGMTEMGGTSNLGIIFSCNTDGSNFQNLHNFTGSSTDGAFAVGSLILDNGVLYGMTFNGGTFGVGIIFSCNTDGSNFRDLHDFSSSSTDGANPFGSLILDSGVLYGMAFGGGLHTVGIIFSCNTDGSNFRDLHDFSGSSTDGANPFGSLILDSGVLYGMTEFGGASGNGIIFSCNTDGSNFQDLHDFTGSGGANPLGSLILDSGILYGMTEMGGASGDGIIFSCNKDGSNFQDLHDFTGSPTDGANPFGSLILDSGVLYGTALAGGAHGKGIIFYLLVPVSNLTGHQLKNDFAIGFERFNKLNWQAFPFPSSAVQGYYVYRNGVKIATLSNTTFTFEEHNIKKGMKTSYSVTSFDVHGNQSIPATVTIK